MIHPTYAEQFVVTETVRRLLDLRETLVRFDENLAAYHLLSQCVPHFALDHPDIVQARDDQHAMVRHVLPDEEDTYAAYYERNTHELRFENQYGLSIEDVHRLPRVQSLRMGLKDQTEQTGERPRVLDLGCNDGFMAARLALDGYTCDGVDLHPGNIEIARERKADYPAMGDFAVGDAVHDFATMDRGHDAVVAFELIEHVQDPAELLHVMRRAVKPGGALYVSTPNAAVEGGNLPTWAHVEPKGHVRVFRPQDFRALLETVGKVDRFELGDDGVLCARVRPG